MFAREMEERFANAHRHAQHGGGGRGGYRGGYSSGPSRGSSFGGMGGGIGFMRGPDGGIFVSFGGPVPTSSFNRGNSQGGRSSSSRNGRGQYYDDSDDSYETDSEDERDEAWYRKYDEERRQAEEKRRAQYEVSTFTFFIFKIFSCFKESVLIIILHLVFSWVLTREFAGVLKKLVFKNMMY